MSSRLSLIDAGFLISESRRMPQHVGGLSVYDLPDGVDETEFLHELSSFLKGTDQYASPFGHTVKTGPLGVYGPMSWQRDRHMDMEYHVRHSALPKPGRYRELFALVSRLHSSLLDRSRPLWEVHLIEGLEDRQFAFFTKMHHSAVDGVRAAQLTTMMHSTDPNTPLEQFTPFSETARQILKKRSQGASLKKASKRDWNTISEIFSEQLGQTVNVSKAVMQHAKVWLGRDETGLDVPIRHVPSTILNSRVQGARRIVAQSWSFDRVRRLAKSYDGTMNDAVLAMVSGALRRYLKKYGEIPDESLKTLTVASLRSKGDVDASNAIGNMSTDLATNINDPVKRTLAIQKSAQIGKKHLMELSASEAELYMALTMSPIAFIHLLGLMGRFPPYSTVVSNVPGAREQLYWNGARLVGSYPASIVVDGIALNFTVVSTHSSMDFGITACRRSVPQVQRLIDYIEDSLVELENAFGLSPWGESEPAQKKTAVKRKTVARKSAETNSGTRSGDGTAQTNVSA